ncbi:MAG TPA: WYL domain-containing protein [Pseudoclavibacter sp.]|nr:WYL domain-containing protein [Pseudoclavibacter sp.]
MSAALSAANRFAFMVAVVPYLMETGGASVRELAERFEMTPDQVRRLIETIATSGVPGDSGAYLDMDLFDINWDAFDRGEVILTRTIALDRVPRLSSLEVAAIVTGLQLLDVSLDPAAASIAESVQAKLRQDTGYIAGSSEVGDELSAVRSALNLGRTLSFDYVDAHGTHSLGRRVDPAGLHRYEQEWYLRGWCHSAQAMRTFRLSRMSRVRVTEDAATPQKPELRTPSWSESAAAQEVTVRVDPTALAFLSWYADAPRTVMPSGEVEARIVYVDGDALVRAVMAFPGRVRIVDDPALSDALRARARSALSRYHDAS